MEPRSMDPRSMDPGFNFYIKSNYIGILMPQVLVHYNYYHIDQIKDFIVDDQQMVESILDSDNSQMIMIKDAVKQRIVVTEIPQLNDQMFDNQLVRYGYALGMKKDPVKGRQIKIPKKDHELRDLFDFHDPVKASFWTNDYDTHVPITEDNCKSIFRGFFSARGSVRPGNQGYVNIVWSKYEDNQDNDSESLLSKLEDYTPCNIEYNGQYCFMQNDKQIAWFLTNIGFIQSDKHQQVITLYKSKMYKVAKIIPVTDDSFIYHYVHSYGNPEDYLNPLLTINAKTLNYVDRSNGKTPFHAALRENRYNSLYPALWLLQNGANINTQNKRHETALQLIFHDDLISQHKHKDFFKEFMIELLNRNLFIKQPLFIGHTFHFIDYSHDPDYAEHYYEILQTGQDICKYEDRGNEVIDKIDMIKPIREQIIDNQNIIKNLVKVIVEHKIRYRNSEWQWWRDHRSNDYNKIIGMFEVIEQAIADGAPVDIPWIEMTINATFNSIDAERYFCKDINNNDIIEYDGKEKYDKNIYRDVILLLKIFDIPSKNRILETIKMNKHFDNLLGCYPEIKQLF